MCKMREEGAGGGSWCPVCLRCPSHHSLFPIVCGYLRPPCFHPVIPRSAVPLSTPRAVACGSGRVVLQALVVVIVVLPLDFVLPQIWLSWPCHHPHCSPFPPPRAVACSGSWSAVAVVVPVVLAVQLWLGQGTGNPRVNFVVPVNTVPLRVRVWCPPRFFTGYPRDSGVYSKPMVSTMGFRVCM